MAIDYNWCQPFDKFPDAPFVHCGGENDGCDIPWADLCSRDVRELTTAERKAIIRHAFLADYGYESDLPDDTEFVTDWVIYSSPGSDEVIDSGWFKATVADIKEESSK